MSLLVVWTVLSETRSAVKLMYLLSPLYLHVFLSVLRNDVLTTKKITKCQ
jgi:hypothetical protein